MDSNFRYQLHEHQQQQQHQPNSGLIRFRSVLSNLAQQGGAGGDSSASNKGASTSTSTTPGEGSCSSEPERLVLRFLNSSDDTASPCLREFEEKPSPDSKALNESTTSSPSISRMNSHKGYLPSRFMRHSSASSSSVDCSFGLVGSVGKDLPRPSSFPLGHLSGNISFQNGYDTMKGVGNYGGLNGSDAELSLSTTKLNSQISFSSRSPPSLRMLSQISKMGSEGIEATSHGGFPYGSWSETSEKLSGSKRERNSNDKLFFDAQNGELGSQVHTLSHHLSFPKASSEMFAMENMIQLPDSVPCKIRAKRGCATHPRSIAERVRRTRISERMRKLQELVPNMDKQTTTADMLDLAVGYIKDLQKQFKNLSERRAKCKCIIMPNSDSNKTA